MTNNPPSGAKVHRESTEPESHQTAKMFFFSFLLLLLRASSNLRDSFTIVFAQTAAFFTEQCTSSLLFSMFEVRFEPLTEELWLP